MTMMEIERDDSGLELAKTREKEKKREKEKRIEKAKRRGDEGMERTRRWLKQKDGRAEMQMQGRRDKGLGLPERSTKREKPGDD